MLINWAYADKFGELPGGEAEKVEALVAIAEQLAELNQTMKSVLAELKGLDVK